MVQALRLNTMSKLTFADTSRFDALVKDVFSGVHLTNLVDQRLVHALEEVYKEAQLELTPSQVCFYEIICSFTKGMSIVLGNISWPLFKIQSCPHQCRKKWFL